MALSSAEISGLYERLADELLAFFMRRTFDAEASVDLLGETFAAAFQDRRRFRGDLGEDGRAWVYAIARHRLSDYQRRGRVERRALAALGVERRPLTDHELDRIEELAGSQELRRRVATELSTLPREQREAVEQRVVLEQPYPQIAFAAGVSEQVIRARVSRGLRSLRESLENPGAPEHA